MTFDDEVKVAVPAVWNMISSSADHQQSEEAYNTGNFELPNPQGKRGGACTASFLQQQYAEGPNGQSWVDTLKKMKEVLKSMGHAQTPTLSSSRRIDFNETMRIVPDGSGRRRAMLIGINYVGQKGELSACHNDALSIKDLLVNAYGFREEEMLILIDDGQHPMPTKKNIEDGMMLLTKYSQPGDVVFISFSGHGGRTEDLNFDEDDGWDETLIPVDFQQNGQIVDDDILKMLVKPMRAGVTCTVLMDCCHSGTVLDLPYKFGANDSKVTIEDGFNMEAVTEAVRPERPSEAKIKEARRQRKQEKRLQAKEEAKRAKEEEEDQGPLGPKHAPNGQPVLPTRRAAKPAAGDENPETAAYEPPPPPPGQCQCTIQ